jgi:hypothetical protein
MKSSIVKTVLLASAALAMGAIASSASAKTLNYTLGISGGGSYCDGLSLTSSDNGIIWSGTHTGSCQNGDPAGGLAVKVKHNSTPYLDIATTYTVDGPSAYTFFLNIPSATWFLYTVSGGVFEEINSGPLLNGVPPAEHGLKSSLHKDPKTVLSSPF